MSEPFHPGGFFPIGRPSKWKAEYCQQIVDFMGTPPGRSFSAFCGSIGIAISTGQEWRKQYPEFQYAYEQGNAVRAMLLEADMLATENATRYNARRGALAKAAPEDWGGDTKVEVGVGGDGGPVTGIQVTFVAPSNASD